MTANHKILDKRKRRKAYLKAKRKANPLIGKRKLEKRKIFLQLVKKFFRNNLIVARRLWWSSPARSEISPC